MKKNVVGPPPKNGDKGRQVRAAAGLVERDFLLSYPPDGGWSKGKKEKKTPEGLIKNPLKPKEE